MKQATCGSYETFDVDILLIRTLFLEFIQSLIQHNSTYPD